MVKNNFKTNAEITIGRRINSIFSKIVLIVGYLKCLFLGHPYAILYNQYFRIDEKAFKT